jgi:hypothetical protein
LRIDELLEQNWEENRFRSGPGGREAGGVVRQLPEAGKSWQKGINHSLIRSEVLVLAAA